MTRERLTKKRQTRVAALATIFACVLGTLGCTGEDGATDEPTGLSVFERSQLGIASADEEASVVLQAERDRMTQVQDCMTEAGFEYVQPDPRSVVATYDGPDRSSAEFAEQYGFGMSTSLPAVLGLASDPAVQANESYRLGLGSSAQERFDEALASCESSADASTPAELVTATNQFNQTMERVRSSDGFLHANERWRECAAAAGYDATTIDEFVLDFARRAAEVSADSTALTNVQADEITAAKATLNCTADYRREMVDLYTSI